MSEDFVIVDPSETPAVEPVNHLVDITALTLSDAEKEKILLYWNSPMEFLLWQRDALATEIERRAGIKAQETFSSFVVASVEEAKTDFPTLFENVNIVPDAEVV